MPQIEERIELNLLEKFKSSLKSDLERKEVENAYLQRKDNLAKVRGGDEMIPTPPQEKLNNVKLPLYEYG